MHPDSTASHADLSFFLYQKYLNIFYFFDFKNKLLNLIVLTIIKNISNINFKIKRLIKYNYWKENE